MKSASSIAPLAHVHFVEHAFGETPEEARHAAFEHLSARRYLGSAGRDGLAEGQKGVLVAACAM